MEDTKEKIALTARQLSVIPHLIATPSIEEACRRAKISKPTVYTWLKQEAFQAELSHQRRQAYGDALEALKTGQKKAVEKLMKLVESKDENVALRASSKAIEFGIRLKELDKPAEPVDDFYSADILLEAWNEVRPKYYKDEELTISDDEPNDGDALVPSANSLDHR